MTTGMMIRRTMGAIGILLGLAAGSCQVRSEATLVINEVLPSNSTHCSDEVNERNDWVEIYNTGDEVLDLEGFSLTDDSASPRKSVIPAGVKIAARGVLLFWADGTPEQGKMHLSFKFKSKAEGVLLYDPEEKQVDVYRWTDAVSDVSFARVPDGTGNFVVCANPTCGSTNGTSCGN